MRDMTARTKGIRSARREKNIYIYTHAYICRGVVRGVILYINVLRVV